MINYQILIPAYNAASTIGRLLSQIYGLKEKPKQVIVVNDGSDDNTESVVAKTSAKILTLPKNSGKGAALKYGFKYFLDDSNDEYLLCMDADLQHPVSSIQKFIELAKTKNIKFIIGNRKKSIKVMPWHRILSNLMTSIIISLMAKQRIYDSQCGFRMIHRDVLNSIHLKENGFQLESEMIIKAAENNVKIHFLNIPTIYNTRGSHINNWKDTFRFISFILKFIKDKLLCIFKNKD